jgi:hypothetical protein
MQIAQEHVVRGALEVGESFLERACTVHAQALGGKAFLEKHAEAFFIIENKQTAVFEKFSRRPDVRKWSNGGFRR